MSRPHRSIVLVSLPRVCAACDGVGRLALVSVAGMRATGTVRCPHCQPEPGRLPLPIFIYPTRTDEPRRAV